MNPGWSAMRKLELHHDTAVSQTGWQTHGAPNSVRHVGADLFTRGTDGYCAAWLLVADWFSSCCNWSNWRSWSTLAELEVVVFRGLVGVEG